MSHVRQQIRDKVAEILTGLATTGNNVFKSRVYPLASGELPGLCIYTNTEESDPETGKYDVFDERTVRVVIEGYDKLLEGVPDSLDDISAEVETALFANEYLDGLAQKIDYAGIPNIQIVGDSENKAGVIPINFDVTYYVERGAPEVSYGG